MGQGLGVGTPEQVHILAGALPMARTEAGKPDSANWDWLPLTRLHHHPDGHHHPAVDL